jgi:hypothetical protein
MGFFTDQRCYFAAFLKIQLIVPEGFRFVAANFWAFSRTFLQVARRALSPALINSAHLSSAI